jgi:hypothetical protein
MTQKNYHGWTCAPERSQLYRLVVHVGQGDIGKPAAIGFSHGLPFSWGHRLMSRMNRHSFFVFLC